jgi:CDP-6-deoxy-D-xylo-4-hexulose-3-dehydrase
MSKLLDIKHQIHALIKEYHDEAFKQKEFVPGESAVPVSGKVVDHKELHLHHRFSFRRLVYNR